jgi:hypothetical protein
LVTLPWKGGFSRLSFCPARLAASIVGHLVGLTELAFHHDEDGLHGPLLSRGPLKQYAEVSPGVTKMITCTNAGKFYGLIN